MNNMNKLYTFVNTDNSLKYLEVFLEKILNNKSYHLKYIDNMDTIGLDLLFTGIKYTLIDNKYNYEKLDNKELEYYIKNANGISYFTKQNKKIHNKEVLINYLINNFKNGNYYYSMDNSVRIGNLLVKVEWLVEISNFLINSILLEEFISEDRKEFTYRLFENNKNINNSCIYEYKVTKSNKGKIQYYELLYIYDTLSMIDKYKFSDLKELNSILNKEGYILSISKNSLKGIDKEYLEYLSKEQKIEYINDKLKIGKREKFLLKMNNNNNYELLRSLAHAYKEKFSLKKCRGLVTKDNNLVLSLYFSKYYLSYVYDSKELNNCYDYESIKTTYLRPLVIDYNSNEYRDTLKKMSLLSKKIVRQNKVINKNLTYNLVNIDKLKEKSGTLAKACNRLCVLVKNKKILDSKLSILTNDNKRSRKTLIGYLTEAILTCSYKIKNNQIDFNLLDNNQKIFAMTISLNTFKEFINDEKNVTNRIKFYEK